MSKLRENKSLDDVDRPLLLMAEFRIRVETVLVTLVKLGDSVHLITV